MRQRIRWLALHGVIRGLSTVGLRSGDPQARLIADPEVRANPAAFADELRGRGPVIRCRSGADHLRSRRRERAAALRRLSGQPRSARTCPGRCGGWSTRPTPGCCTRCDRRRCCRSSRRSTPATASWCRRFSRREPLPRFGNGWSRPPPRCSTTSAATARVVDVVDRYCSQLPVAVIGDILGVPEQDRPRILQFGELAAPSLDIGLSWQQYMRVHRGLEGFNTWLADHLQAAAAQPRRRPDEPADPGQRRGRRAAQQR